MVVYDMVVCANIVCATIDETAATQNECGAENENRRDEINETWVNMKLRQKGGDEGNDDAQNSINCKDLARIDDMDIMCVESSGSPFRYIEHYI